MALPGEDKIKVKGVLRPWAKLEVLGRQQAAWILLGLSFLDSSHVPGEEGGVLYAGVHVCVCCAFQRKNAP